LIHKGFPDVRRYTDGHGARRLQVFVGKSEIKFSLRTRDPVVALRIYVEALGGASSRCSIAVAVLA
jgi:hypothetical protein